MIRKRNFKTHPKLVTLLLICFMLSFFNASSYAQTSPVNQEKEFKNFYLTDMQNVKHKLSSYKGKWVIVNYWATWCPPCLEEVPDLVALYDSRKNKDVMVIGVVFDYESADEVNSYVNDMLMSYPIVLGDDNAVNQIGSADVMPTTFIYNPKGTLVKIKRGLVTKSYLEEVMTGANLLKVK